MIRTGDLFFCRTYTVMGMIASNIGEWEWHIGILCNVIQNGTRINYVLDANAHGVVEFKPLNRYLESPLVFDAGVRHLNHDSESYERLVEKLQPALMALKGKPFEISMSNLLKIGSNNDVKKEDRRGYVCTEMVHTFIKEANIANVEDIPALSPPEVYMGGNEKINGVYHPMEKLETKKWPKETVYKLMMRDAEKSLGMLLAEKMVKNS